MSRASTVISSVILAGGMTVASGASAGMPDSVGDDVTQSSIAQKKFDSKEIEGTVAYDELGRLIVGGVLISEALNNVLLAEVSGGTNTGCKCNCDGQLCSFG